MPPHGDAQGRNAAINKADGLVPSIASITCVSVRPSSRPSPPSSESLGGSGKNGREAFYRPPLPGPHVPLAAQESATAKHRKGIGEDDDQDASGSISGHSAGERSTRHGGGRAASEPQPEQLCRPCHGRTVRAGHRFRQQRGTLPCRGGG